MAIKSFSRATETEYMCPLCSETAIRWLGEPAPICEECGVEMEFFDGPDDFEAAPPEKRGRDERERF